MTVKYHSLKQNAIVTVELTDEQVAELKCDFENLPFHNGCETFEDFVLLVLAYND